MKNHLEHLPTSYIPVIYYFTRGYGTDSIIVLCSCVYLCAGLMDNSVLREYLSGPRLEIEVHDRDRVIQIFEEKGSLFGEGIDDDKISNVGTVTSEQ